MEHAVFESTIEAHRPRLTQILRRFRIPEEDADDLLQEAFVSLYVHWDAVRDPCGYLIIAMNRLCLRFKKKWRRRLTHGMDEAVLEMLAEPLPPPQERVDAWHDTRELLSRLTVKQRRALYLRRILELTPKEIALSTGMQVAATRRLVEMGLESMAKNVLEARERTLKGTSKGRQGRSKKDPV